MKRLLTFALLISACVCLAQEAPVPDAGNVTLPLSEYNRLIELASKPPKKPAVPPLAYAIKSIDMKLRVEKESAIGTIQVEGEVLSKGITRVPLTSGMTVLDIRQDGKPVPLHMENGTQVVVLNGPADFSLTLDAGLPISIENRRAALTIPVPVAGSARMSLTIPGEYSAAAILPGYGLITGQTSANGQTVVEGTLNPARPVTVWWTTREVLTPAVPREVRFLSSIKTLVSVGDNDLRLAALTDVTIVQGQPSEFALEIPTGYEVTGVSGSNVDSADVKDGALMVKLIDPSAKSHQFLISLERPITNGNVDVPFLTIRQAQRETGEVLVEGAGTMELTATEGGSLKRMDVKETNEYLRGLAHYPPQAAFRYHRQPNEAPALKLDWVRFPDTGVLAAVADNAQVTTLVTSEGKSLTEVKLTVRNQAQPFLKVDLPAGASILSADVAGEKVKPVQGTDGNRVPLLRPGFRPTDAYSVSFVFMHSGTPFAKKGGSDLTLPKLDIPIELLQWEVFLPERYKVKDFGGDAIAEHLVPAAFREDQMSLGYAEQPNYTPVPDLDSLGRGEIGGYVVDPSGAVVPGTKITITNTSNGWVRVTESDGSGRWRASGIAAGDYVVKAEARAFKTWQQRVSLDGSPFHLSMQLMIGSVAESVSVEASAVQVQDYSRQIEREAKKAAQQAQNAPTSNVYNLQKRVSGVLPVAVEVPKTGMSYRFVRPLVLGEETKVTFSYNSK